MNCEVWKPVVGYEGLYEVSNYGNIRSLDKRVGWWQNKTRVINGRIISQYKLDRYPKVRLTKDKTGKMKYVHRLVAEAFIPNPDKLPEVNHIDENKMNNHVDNLEWCTREYNNSYGTRLERQLLNFDYEGVARKISETKRRIRYDGINQLTLDGEFVKWFPTIKSAHIETGHSKWMIGACCRGNSVQTGGYKWEYNNYEELYYEK